MPRHLTYQQINSWSADELARFQDAKFSAWVQHVLAPNSAYYRGQLDAVGGAEKIRSIDDWQRAGIPLVRKSEYRPTLVKRGATLGANCTVVCGTTIGRHAFVGAGAVVSRDVPDFALVVGVPARPIGWVSRHGERLTFAGDAAVCPATGERYVLRDGVCALANEASS